MTVNFQQGIVLAFDKPYEWTSFGVVARVRRLITEHLGGAKIKVGHAGTLDPLATGVILICTGRATRLIDELQSGVKAYTATLALGATTPSFDLEHDIDATYPTAHITRQLIEETLPKFLGEIEQVPPAYSACKIEGKRAYDLARKGQEVSLKAKTLKIEQIDIVDCDLANNRLTLHIVCSKGTYIRALARDIGTALGSGAHLTDLRRTQVGKTFLPHCFTLDSFEAWLNGQMLTTEVLDNQTLVQQREAVRRVNADTPDALIPL